MSKKAFVTVQNSFADEASRAFRFLVSEFGLEGPEFQGVVLPAVAFPGSGIRYRVTLDTDDKIVMTSVEIDLEKKRLVAELEDLVETTGLGARNRVAQSAHTVNSMQRALESQANYTRLLQPYMKPQAIVQLMQSAGAREWHTG